MSKPERYTDTDVRADLDVFKALAYSYLGQYHGDFHVLVDFKRIHLNGEALNVRQIRTVLNCMLIDPRVTNMPTPSDHRFDARGYRVRKVNFEDDPFGEEYEIDQPRVQHHRPAKVQMTSKVNYTFGISNSKQAFVIHRVDYQVTPVTWYPQTGELSASTQWICTTEKRTKKNSILLSEYAVESMLGKPAIKDRVWKACNACTLYDKERRERQAEIDETFRSTRL